MARQEQKSKASGGTSVPRRRQKECRSFLGIGGPRRERKDCRSVSDFPSAKKEVRKPAIDAVIRVAKLSSEKSSTHGGGRKEAQLLLVTPSSITRNFDSIRDVGCLKRVAERNTNVGRIRDVLVNMKRAPKKNTKIVRRSVFVAADPFPSSPEQSDAEEVVVVVPTRSELIARFGRAILLPSEQCRQAIGGVRESGRPLPNNYQVSNPDVLTRDSRKYLPNHSQIFDVLAKVIPLPHVARFNASLEAVMKSNHKGDVVGGRLEGDKLCKTPLVWVAATLRDTFGSSNIDIRRCHNVGGSEEEVIGVTSDHFLEFIVMDCVLERTFKIQSSTGAVATLDRDDGLRSSDANDPVTHVLADCVEEVSQRHDYKFRTAIIVVPSAGIFYCARERRRATHGVAGSHNPLDISWLRIRKWQGDGVDWFHKGGYVRHLSFGNENPVGKKLSPTNPVGFVGACSVWKIGIRRAGLQFPGVFSNMPVVPPASRIVVYDAYQCPDDSGPRLPPDVFDGKDKSKLGKARLREMYNSRLIKAPSVRKHCRCYVRGCLHCFIPAGALFINPLETPNVDVRLKMQYSDPVTEAVVVKRECVLQMRYLLEIAGSDSLLEEVRQHAQMVAESTKGQARSNCGDQGSMHPIGMRVMQNKSEGTYVSSTRSVCLLDALRGSVEASAMLAEISIPGVLRVIQDLETDSGLEYLPEMSGVPCDAGTQRVGRQHNEDSGLEDMPEMVPRHGTPYVSTNTDRTLNFENESQSQQGFSMSTEEEDPGSGDGKQCVGMLRVSTTMDVSVNLANASHYDVNDASQGFSIWTEDEPGTTEDWYFVLPNVYGQIPGTNETYNGLAIRLMHGVLVSWDGRVVRHCTSMMNRRSNVYGTFYASKSKNIALGQRQCELEQQAGLQAAIASATHADIAVEIPHGGIVVTGAKTCAGTFTDGSSTGDSSTGGPTGGSTQVRATGGSAGNGSESESEQDGCDDSIGCRIEFSNTQQWVPHGSIDACVMTPTDVGSVQWRGVGFMDPRRSTNHKSTPMVREWNKGILPKREMEEEPCDCSSCSGWVCVRYAGNCGETRGNQNVGLRARTGLAKWTFNAQQGHFVSELLFAQRVEVPCVHLQYHIEALWDLLLPESSTLRSGLDWTRGFPCYFVELVHCRTQFPIDRFDSEWKDDDTVLRKFVLEGLMVGIEGEDNRDHRLIPIGALNAAVFLGAKAVYFPNEACSDVFARRFGPYLPSEEARIERSSCAFPDGTIHYKLGYSLPVATEENSIVYYQPGCDISQWNENPLFNLRSEVCACLEDLAGLEYIRYAMSSMKVDDEVKWEHLRELVFSFGGEEATFALMLQVARRFTSIRYGINRILANIGCHLVQGPGKMPKGCKLGWKLIMEWASMDDELLEHLLDPLDKIEKELVLQIVEVQVPSTLEGKKPKRLSDNWRPQEFATGKRQKLLSDEMPRKGTLLPVDPVKRAERSGESALGGGRIGDSGHGVDIGAMPSHQFAPGGGGIGELGRDVERGDQFARGGRGIEDRGRDVERGDQFARGGRGIEHRGRDIERGDQFARGGRGIGEQSRDVGAR